MDDAGITQVIGASMMGLLHGAGLNDYPSWWLEEMGRGLEEMFGNLDDYMRGDADDGLLDDAEREFMEAAHTLAANAPNALAQVALHWRRRALGVAAPDWEGVLP